MCLIEYNYHDSSSITFIKVFQIITIKMADDTTTDGRFCQEIKEDIDRVMEHEQSNIAKK